MYGNKKRRPGFISSYAQGSKPAKEYKGLGAKVTAPSEIKPEGKPKEKLIYATDEEIRILKAQGGSGAKTPFGPRSYSDPDLVSSATSNTLPETPSNPDPALDPDYDPETE